MAVNKLQPKSPGLSRWHGWSGAKKLLAEMQGHNLIFLLHQKCCLWGLRTLCTITREFLTKNAPGFDEVGVNTTGSDLYVLRGLLGTF